MTIGRYQALLQERAELVAEASRILATAEAAGRALSTEEAARDDQIYTRLMAIAPELAAIEAEREAQRATPGGGVMTRPDGPARSPKYTDMFPQAATDRGGFKDFGEYALVVHNGLYHPQIGALMQGGDGTGTGYLIPPQFAAELLDRSLEDEVVRPRARIEPMTSDTKVIAGLTHDSGAAGPYGGIGGWVREAQEITDQSPEVRSIKLAAQAVKVLTQISNEALADGTSIEQQLGRALPKALGWHLDLAFLSGTGAGQPLGILNAPATVEVAKEAGQTADTIVYANLTKMFSRLHPASVQNAVWVANPTAIPQLLTLTVAVGSGGSHIPVMTESGGEFRLLTRPVVFTEKVPALGDRGDISLCDFSQYVVGLRAELRLERSAHIGFTRDTTYYRAVLRADGQPLLDAPYTPKHGQTTSPFVTLAERA